TKDSQQQAVKEMIAQAYKTKDGSKNFMDIGIDATELQIGDQLKVYLNTGKSPGFRDQDFTYMVKITVISYSAAPPTGVWNFIDILSKGQIVKVDRFKRKGQSVVALYLPITKDMVPSFRIVAYYHVGSSEVVSDSVW
ncbi:hypothetical protein M9458_000464, partial [Cirrhinus mrigala]